MLTIRAMNNGAGYAARHLVYSDYLDEQNKLKGLWKGQAAERLGLSGEVTPEQFERLRECEHPDTGEFLRQRRSADRVAADGSKQSNAVHLYDLTFSAPKSISIQGVLEDQRLIIAHEKAVTVALAEAESFGAVEDQRKGQKMVRQTGNLAIATYTHNASRQLDPQIHTHAVVFNLSFDEKTNKWKALDARGFYERRSYLTEVYRNVFAREVMNLGYEIENRWNGKGTDRSFEIKQISPELCKKFSKRSSEKESAIEQFIQERGREPSNNEVSVLVRNTREDKLRAISTAEVRHHQRSQLTPQEAQLLTQLHQQTAESSSVHPQSPAIDSLEYAKEHLFERVSVAYEHQLLTEALQHGRGKINLQELKTHTRTQASMGVLIAAHGQVATQESLLREQGMIGTINRANGRHETLADEQYTFSPQSNLSPEQARAVQFILKSRDLAVCLQGAAGTGKTDTLREIKRGLTEAGRSVAAVAPTQTAVRELKQRGFDEAITIARLLQDKELQSSLFGKALIVDEAGMVSGKQMAGLLELAEKSQGRLILVGDTQQIKSVEASDALRILQKESKLKTTKLHQVKRQVDPAYRAASQKLWKDREKGFAMLEKMGAVQEVSFLDRPQATVDAFMKAKEQRNRQGEERTVLVVCPTHEEINRYTEAIRSNLKASGKLSQGKKIDSLEPLNWTLAQRKDVRSYEPGQVLVFHKGVKNIKRNEAVTVKRQDGSKVIVSSGKGKEIALTGKQAGAFNLFARRSIEIAPGDQLLLQANFRQHGLEVTNGDVALVRQLDSKGRIHLQDGRILPPNYRQLKHGYAMTAHRSQGKSADAVIVSADRMDGDLFYVAASRGRELVRILTSNLPLLRSSVSWDANRQSATELVAQTNQKKRQRRRRMLRARRAARNYQQQLLRPASKQKRPTRSVGSAAHAQELSSPALER